MMFSYDLILWCECVAGNKVLGCMRPNLMIQ